MTVDQGGFRIISEMSIGQILNASIMLLGLICGGIVWATGKGNSADQTQRDLVQFRGDLTSQINEVKTSLNTGIANIQTQIGGLPTQSATIEQLKSEASATQQRFITLEGKIESLETKAGQLRVDLDVARGTVAQMKAASDAPLGSIRR